MLAAIGGAAALAALARRPVTGFAARDDRPARFRWKIEAQDAVAGLGDFQHGGAVAALFGRTRDLVVESVRQPF